MAGKNDKADFSLTIGLNMDDLFAGMDEANTTIRQAISRINSESTQVKFKADTAALQTGISEVEKMRVQQQALTRQIELQTAKMRLLKQARDSVYKSAGANSTAGRGAETAYLRQARTVAQLNADLASLQGKLDAVGRHGAGAFERIHSSAELARSRINLVGNAINTIKGLLVGGLGTMMGGFGLFNVTDDAMKAGHSLYQLSTQLHLSTADAVKFKNTFAAAGSDVSVALPIFLRLDRSIQQAGKSGNVTTMALANFGVQLKDSAGNLLPVNQQLAALANAYNNLSTEEEKQAFAAQILGPDGAELITVLQNYKTAVDDASSIKTTGLLNVDDAEKLYHQWVQMRLEGSQLKMALGSALLPVAQEAMPKIKDVIADLVDYIHNHKDEIVDDAGTIASALANVIKLVAQVTSARTTKDEALLTDHDLNYASNKSGAAVGGAAIGATLAGVGVALIPTGIGAIPGAMLIGGGAALGAYGASSAYKNAALSQNSDKLAAYREQAEMNADFAKKYPNFDPWTGDWHGNADKNAPKTFAQSLELLTQTQKKEEEQTRKNAAAAREAAKAVAERNTQTGKLKETILDLTQSEYQQSVRRITEQAQEYLAGGAPDELVETYKAAALAKQQHEIGTNLLNPLSEAWMTDRQKSNAEIDQQANRYLEQYRGAGYDWYINAWREKRKEQISADWDKEVASQIDSVWKDSLTKRLDEIEREKQAWIKKGLDEVKATKWAEEQKHEAMESTAQSMFSSDRKYFKAWQAAGGINSGQAGVEAIERVMRRERGIPAGAATSPAELQAFSAAMKSANDNLVPIISDGTYRGVKQAYIEVLRGNYSTQEAVPTAAAYPAATQAPVWQAPAAQAAQDIVYHEWTPEEQAEVMKNAPLNYEGQLADELKLNTDALHDSVEAIDKNTSKQDSLTNPATTPADSLGRYADLLEAAAKPNYGLEAYTDALAMATQGMYAPPAPGGFDPALTRRTTPPEQSRGRDGNSVTVNIDHPMLPDDDSIYKLADEVAGKIIERSRLDNAGNSYGR